MLTDFFFVTEQDNMLSENLRHKKGNIGDMPEKLNTGDVTLSAETDFHSTFLEVSQHRDSNSSEMAKQVDPKKPQGNDTVGRSSEIKDRADTERTDDEKKISEPARKESAQMPGINGSDDAAAKIFRAAGKMVSDHTKGELPLKPETLKGLNPAKLKMKGAPTSADTRNPKSTPILSDTTPPKGHPDFIHHKAGRGPNLMVPVSSGRIAVQASAEMGGKGSPDLKMAMAGGKEKGMATPAGETASSRKIASRAGVAAEKKGLPDLKMGMQGAKEKGMATPAGERASSRKIASRAGVAAEKKGLPDLKMGMQGAKEKGMATPAGESVSSRRMDGQASAETGKNDGPGSRGVYGAHAVRSSDQGTEQALVKAYSGGKGEEVLSRGKGFRPPKAFSASGMERRGKDSGGPSKRNSVSRELPFKSSHTDVRSKIVAGEGEQAENDRHGKKGSRFNFTRDAQEGNHASKAKPEDQAVETTRGKRENGFSAIKFANRATRHASEHGFDRNAPKPQMNAADSLAFTASNTSSPTKTPGNISRFGEMEMVRRSFQDIGLRQLVNKAALNLKNGQQEFRIELKPELLGQVKVQVSTENHQVTIRILTELPMAKEMIENNLHQLKADLQGHGLEIEKFEVSLSQGSDKNGVEHGSSGSKKMKKGLGQKKVSKAVSSTPDMEKEDWARNQSSSNGAISFFA